MNSKNVSLRCLGQSTKSHYLLASREMYVEQTALIRVSKLHFRENRAATALGRPCAAVPPPARVRIDFTCRGNREVWKGLRSAGCGLQRHLSHVETDACRTFPGTGHHLPA